MSFSDNFEFYSTEKYFRHLAESVSKTVNGDRVILTAMTFDPQDELIAILMEQMNLAAKRGVKVTIIIDSYTFISNGFSKIVPFVFSTRQTHKNSPIIKSLEQLKANGGNYTVLNKPKNPFRLIYSGRFHAKLAVINNRVYVGGCNLSDTSQIDMMIGWEDEPTANKLVDMCNRIIQPNYRQAAFNGQDQEIELSKTSSLIFDAGIKCQSTIMAKAFEIIDEAERSIYFACQYYPNSLTTRHLIKAAKRGVEVTILFNHPSQHSFPNSLIHRLVMQKQSWLSPSNLNLIKLPKNEHYMHAKLIATEKSAILGSHNYIVAGVNFGTTEIAVYDNNPDFSKAAIETVTNQIVNV